MATRRVCFTVVLRMLVLRCGLFRFFAWISIVLGNAGRNGLAVGISMRYSDAGHSRVSHSSPGKVGPSRSETARMMGENSTISCLVLILTSSRLTSFHASGIPALTGSDVHSWEPHT